MVKYVKLISMKRLFTSNMKDIGTILEISHTY